MSQTYQEILDYLELAIGDDLTENDVNTLAEIEGDQIEYDV